MDSGFIPASENLLKPRDVNLHWRASRGPVCLQQRSGRATVSSSSSFLNGTVHRVSKSQTRLTTHTHTHTHARAHAHI